MILGTLPAGALRPGDRVVVGAEVCTVRAVELVGGEVCVTFQASCDVEQRETWRITAPVTVVT